jgi:hypothetical protein
MATSSNALAADPAPDALVSQGVEAFRHQDYEAARIDFGRAYELAPNTPTLLNLALAELQSGHALIAVKHFRQVLRARDLPAEKVEYVRSKMLPRGEALTARLVIEAPKGSDVLVDRQLVGQAPLGDPIDVDAGEHVVEVRLGTSVQRVTTTPPLGSSTRVLVEFVPASQAIEVGPAPSSPRPPLRESVATASSAPPQPFFTAKNATVIALAGGAVVATAIGVAFSLGAKSNADTATELLGMFNSTSACVNPSAPMRATCMQLADANTAHSRDQGTAVGFYVGGGVLAAAAVATWFLWPTAKGHETVAWIVPTVGALTGIEAGASF